MLYYAAESEINLGFNIQIVALWLYVEYIDFASVATFEKYWDSKQSKEESV